ncbi:MAG: SH3 domain-containing protein [Anaerolineales bacterium]|nr:SH3 domain-containing protein [Anaerolineales bacterium]
MVNQSPLIFLYVNLISEEGTAAFDEILNTLGVAGALESEATTEQKALISNPVAVVSTDTLNLRSGPGTNYSKAGVVKQGEALIINGQINDCAWLQVTTPAGAEGWVSGSSQYVTVDGRCADIPAVKAPAPPSGNTSANQNSGKGCLVFQNNINAELTITFTNSGTGKGTTFKVGPKAQQEQCLDPARYTLTVDAPPPWGSFNDAVEITPGLYEAYPINPG